MAVSAVADSGIGRIESILGDDASLLRHECKTISKADLHLPGPDFVDRVLTQTDRSPRVLAAIVGVDPHVLQYGGKQRLGEGRPVWEALAAPDRAMVDAFLSLPAPKRKLVRELVAALASPE